ncbi:myeloid-associated differentiation marker homolog [Cyprinodon tularosa]|uniref:myeloid-associated differentiation marker homolog n=1 Tax=Cyprinodon tularosa TaxID=77115 RepID=UPI0018E24BE0|nr:myeloid-associated differentiation marker homolog [Cyprinodon tularosa]
MPFALKTSPLLWTRLAALAFTCIAFSMAALGGRFIDHTGAFCIFCWAFSFGGTLLVILVELFNPLTRAPLSWKNFHITFACYSFLLCMSASFIFPIYFLKDSIVVFAPSQLRDLRIVSSVSSCVATLAYMNEVRLTKAYRGEVSGYMTTCPGLLKVLETFVACILFVFINDPVSYDQHHSVKYCMSVYCICFILSAFIILLCIGECTYLLPFPFPRFLFTHALLAVFLYLSAAMIWVIFNFVPRYGGHNERPHNCWSSEGLCSWDKDMLIAVLTGINFILYLIDLIYSIPLVLVST